ncbi:MAG: ABC transporter substrate-binding protein [Acidobacteriota bacterium]|nr:ABC transporter substrate-binding protein [Acidobacteriota bacterium]
MGVASSSARSAAKSSRSSGHATLTAGVLHAFTGQNAFFGTNAEDACKAAARVIDNSGGIMGSKLNCTPYDTKGDPADAVPVTRRMLTSASNLVMVVGPDGNDIPSVLPLVVQAKVPEMNTVGDPRYDKQKSPYFWRLTPSDSTMGPALAWYVAHRKLMSIADLFTSDLSAQTTVNPFRNAYRRLQGKLVLSQTIAPDQSSYQTEVAALAGAKVQALVGEMDPQTASTYLTELQQQKGSLFPFISTQVATQPGWLPAVVQAIGAANTVKYLTVVAPNMTGTKAALAQYVTNLKKVGGSSYQLNNTIVAATYDGVISFALAMDMAHSTKPSTYVSYIRKVTTAGKGVKVVHSYAAGAAALKAGKKIDYVGAAGAMNFNSYNTSARPYAVYKYSQAKQGLVEQSVLPSAA